MILHLTLPFEGDLYHDLKRERHQIAEFDVLQ